MSVLISGMPDIVTIQRGQNEFLQRVLSNVIAGMK
jgi:hypothetical protein